MASEKEVLVRNPNNFYALWKKSFEEFGLGVSLEEFTSSTEKILQEKPKLVAVEKLYEIQRASLTADFHKDIDRLWEEANLPEKYTEITKLINQSEENADKIVWRPNGDPFHDLEAYQISALKDKIKKLEKLVENENFAKERLKNKVEQKRNNIKKQLQSITKAEKKLGEMNEALNSCITEFDINENNMHNYID